MVHIPCYGPRSTAHIRTFVHIICLDYRKNYYVVRSTIHRMREHTTLMFTLFTYAHIWHVGSLAGYRAHHAKPVYTLSLQHDRACL